MPAAACSSRWSSRAVCRATRRTRSSSADRLLLVASDRISAFDVVLPTPIPDKGKVLTGLSRFWFDETSGLVANHLLSTDLDDVDPIDRPRSGSDGRRVEADDLRGRVMLCRRVDVLAVEVIVRGYVAGS